MPVVPCFTQKILQAVAARKLHDELLSREHKQALDAVAGWIIRFLRRSKEMGKVIIVTNAETGRRIGGQEVIIVTNAKEDRRTGRRRTGRRGGTKGVEGGQEGG